MNSRPGGNQFGIHPVVFGFSAGLTVQFVVLTLANLGAADAIFSAVKDGIARRFGWFLILSVQGFLLLCIILAASRFRRIRIGGPDARPEFSSVSLFAMLFAAGMGIGLMFWSVAEPVLHLQNPPGAAPMTAEGAQRALDLTFLHWGLHVWGMEVLSWKYVTQTQRTAVLPPKPFKRFLLTTRRDWNAITQSAS